MVNELMSQREREKVLWEKRSRYSNFSCRRLIAAELSGLSESTVPELELEAADPLFLASRRRLEGPDPLFRKNSLFLPASAPAPVTMQLNGMYKKKADKIQPQNVQLTDGSTPGGRIDWREFIMKE
ncbi:hypothetical protein EG327_000602 [Venturia inaequalis]|uniref:Uncharacterized protein n=1 Tax=Venturia inaequalis TaxID=5025 RepID=A0A8H3YPU2_VENIN|nr:hypothetical protein EG327_000602 [Venturia inaequalis]